MSQTIHHISLGQRSFESHLIAVLHKRQRVLTEVKKFVGLIYVPSVPDQFTSCQITIELPIVMLLLIGSRSGTNESTRITLIIIPGRGAGGEGKGRLSSPALFLRISAVQSHYWCTKLWTADKYLLCYLHHQIYLSHKNCSCRRSLRILSFSYRFWRSSVTVFWVILATYKKLPLNGRKPENNSLIR